MATKSPIEKIQEFAQDAIGLTPVILLGSGASAAHGIPGMPPLAKHLKSLPLLREWSADEVGQWNQFCNQLESGVDLETALGAVNLTDIQTGYISSETRSFLLPYDEAVFQMLLSDRSYLPLTRLYRYLFSSTHKNIDVVTPNYDRIAEYAADAGEWCQHAGFSQGYLQVRAKERGRPLAAKDEARTVSVWKVHGSLDWFRSNAGQAIGARTAREVPKEHTPLMVTPGASKYRRTHLEPYRTIMSCADACLQKARSYFCVGYGFNDEHLQEKLVARCDEYSVPLVIISKEITPPTHTFLSSGRCRKYLALEEKNNGTCAYNNDHPAGFQIDGQSLWQMSKFLDFTVGATR